jgi:hypothetical protein
MMRRKRLKDVAHNLCQIFCGWRLINTKARIAELKSGTLEINALTGGCSFNGKVIDQLAIAQELKTWLQGELTTLRIPASAIRRAQLTVELSLSEVDWNERQKRTEQFYEGRKLLQTEAMHSCRMKCNSVIETDEVAYSSEYNDLHEWPIGWPQGRQSVQRSEP